MRRFFLAMAKVVWAITPIPALRQLYFKMFLFLVRGRTAVVAVDGITFALDLSEVIDAAVYLGSYESDVRRAIERHFQPGGIALDIGANVGAHALLLAKKAGPKGKVYAFEPMNYAYRKLKGNIARNVFKNIQAYQIALSNVNLADQEINYRSSWRSHGQSVEEHSRVDFRRLDDWCQEAGVGHVDLIKIDVDGNEFSVLSGAQILLRTSRPVIIIEVGAWHFKEPERNPIEMISKLGYRFRDARTLEEYPNIAAIQCALTHLDNADSGTINVIAELPTATRSSDTRGEPQLV